jgi:serine/threonine protein phosphatase 1
MLTYAIGDVHGCLDRLVPLVQRCLQHSGANPARFVFVGDYIDRGPDSRGVVAFLIALQRDRSDVVCLRGNHEAIMLEALRTGDGRLWYANGGAATLDSYGLDDLRHMPHDHVDWAAGLPLHYDDGLRFYAHAGIDPDVPLDAQDAHDLLWIREPFLSSTLDHGRLVVHGHTPLSAGIPDRRPNRLNIDTGAVYGGPLTAAIFTDTAAGPVGFMAESVSGSNH